MDAEGGTKVRSGTSKSLRCPLRRIFEGIYRTNYRFTYWHFDFQSHDCSKHHCSNLNLIGEDEFDTDTTQYSRYLQSGTNIL